MAESLEAELIEALRARLAVIGDQELRGRDPAAHLERLQGGFRAHSCVAGAPAGNGPPATAPFL